MVESYGPFAKGLAISSGIFAAFIGIAMTVSHPLGIAGAAVVFLLWGFFLKAIAFVGEPQAIQVCKGEPEERPAVGSEEDPYAHLNLYDFSRTAARIQGMWDQEPEDTEPASRILGPRYQESAWDRCHQEDSDRVKRTEPKHGFE